MRIEVDHLFLYGLDPEAPPTGLTLALKKHAIHVGRGTVQGRLYDLDDFAAAVRSNDPEEVVHGDVYRIEDGHTQSMIAFLDLYESADAADPDAPGFTRVAVDIPVDTLIHPQRAWVSWWNGPTPEEARIPGGDYAFHQARKPAPPAKGKRRRS
ncbi:MAG TPA: gamma-glutamylcyclotransferase family protein [Flavobacteriales bacterium]